MVGVRLLSCFVQEMSIFHSHRLGNPPQTQYGTRNKTPGNRMLSDASKNCLVQKNTPVEIPIMDVLQ